MLGGGVPDPFDQVRNPRFRAVPFEALHQILVRKGVQAAKDLAHDADQRKVLAWPGQLAKAVMTAEHGFPQRLQLLAGLDRGFFERAAKVAEALLVNRFRVSATLLVRPADK